MLFVLFNMRGVLSTALLHVKCTNVQSSLSWLQCAVTRMIMRMITKKMMVMVMHTYIHEWVCADLPSSDHCMKGLM